MRFIAATLIVCMTVGSLRGEDADVLRLDERPLDYVAEQIGRGITVVYMGRSNDWFRFDFFLDFEGDGVIGSAHGRYRCRDLVLASNAEDGNGLDSTSMIRVLKVDAQKREVVLDVRSFRDAIKKVVEEKDARPNVAEPPPQSGTSPQP